MIDSFESFCWH